MHAVELPRGVASVGESISSEDVPVCLPWSDVVDLYCVCHNEDATVRVIDELQLSCCTDDDQFVRRYFAIQSFFGHSSQHTTNNIDHVTCSSNNNNNNSELGGASSNDDSNLNPLLQDCMWCHSGLLPDPVLLRSSVSGPPVNPAAAVSSRSTVAQQRINLGATSTGEELLEDGLEDDDVMDDVSDDGGGEMSGATTEDASETEEQCCSPEPPGVATAATAAAAEQASVIARIHNYSSRSKHITEIETENISRQVSTNSMKSRDFLNSVDESISVRLVKVCEFNDANRSAATVGGLSQQGHTHTTPPTYATSWMLSDNSNRSLHNSGNNNNNNDENSRPSPQKVSTTHRQLRRHLTSHNTNRNRKSSSYQRRRFDSVESVSSMTSDCSDDCSTPITRRRLRSITHNILERERRCRMRSRFAALRSCLPNAPRDKRASNATVLRLAVQFVRRLALTSRHRERRLRRLREVAKCLENRLVNVRVENGSSPRDME